jgi:hypothetical protein
LAHALQKVLAKDVHNQRRTIMATDYVWQLGIDWNAIETAGTPPENYPKSYLRGCLSLGSVPLPGTVEARYDDTITFKIFDVTPSGSAGVGSIESLEIFSTAAVKSQADAGIHQGLGLNSSQTTSENPMGIAILGSSPERNSAFGSARACWTANPVYVTAAAGKRFLLTVKVEATETDNSDNKRLFILDPEMVVGPNL